MECRATGSVASPRIRGERERVRGSCVTLIARPVRPPSSVFCCLLPQRRLGGGKARDRHAKRRAGDIVERRLVAERDRGWIAAVLAANSDLELAPRRAPALDTDADQLAHSVPIDGNERVGRKNTARQI